MTNVTGALSSWLCCGRDWHCFADPAGIQARTNSLFEIMARGWEVSIFLGFGERRKDQKESSVKGAGELVQGLMHLVQTH